MTLHILKEKPDLEFRLKIGDQLRLRDKLTGSTEIAYAGMPNDQVFSLLIKDMRFFFTNLGGNLYFPAKKGTITFADYQCEVLDVQPDYITLKNFQGNLG